MKLVLQDPRSDLLEKNVLYTMKDIFVLFCKYNPADIQSFLKVDNRNTRTRCEICSKLTIKTPERRHWNLSDVFFVNTFL